MPIIPGPIPRDEFRRLCSQFATGITVVTTLAADGSPHGFTANSFTSVSADPPLVLVCIDLRSSVLAHFERAYHFAINVLAEDQQPVSVRFAQRDDPRFDGVAWNPGRTGVPVLGGTLATLECRTAERIRLGDHIVLVGEVVVTAYAPGRPLLYFSSRYHRLADEQI